LLRWTMPPAWLAPGRGPPRLTALSCGASSEYDSIPAARSVLRLPQQAAALDHRPVGLQVPGRPTGPAMRRMPGIRAWDMTVERARIQVCMTSFRLLAFWVEPRGFQPALTLT
jgi:hypothetical protein